MIGNIRSLFEKADLDFLFCEHSAIFQVLADDYSLFAYQFYFFYHTQNSQTSLSYQDQEKVLEAHTFTRNRKKNTEIKRLHITHQNYWTLKEKKLVERTIVNFNLGYFDRHFYDESKSSVYHSSDADILSFQLRIQSFLEMMKTCFSLTLWIAKFWKNHRLFSGFLMRRGLPKFPFSQFIARLLMLKFYESNAKYNLKNSSYDEIYFSNYYSLKSLAICSAGKSLGLKTLNLQHGVQGCRHPAFNFRAFKSKKLPQYVPDTFYCFYLNVNHSLIHPETTVIMKKHNTVVNRSEKVKSVLFSMQPSFSMNDDVISALKKLAESGILVKLKQHPRASFCNPLISDLCKSDGITILSNNLHISNALEDVEVHITGFSSSAIDAAKVGVKTYFMDRRALELYSSLISEGFAEVCKSADDLIEKIEMHG